MDPSSIAAIVISLVAALGTWASARASSKATEKASVSSGRVEMEKEAYERARKLDTETILRQDTEMDELRTEVKEVKQENAILKSSNARQEQEILRLQARVATLERELHHGDTGGMA